MRDPEDDFGVVNGIMNALLIEAVAAALVLATIGIWMRLVV